MSHRLKDPKRRAQILLSMKRRITWEMQAAMRDLAARRRVGQEIKAAEKARQR